MDAGPRVALSEEILDRSLGEARTCYAEQRYFDAHEVLEAAWLRADGETRRTLQGLIQAAAAWHHVSCGNLKGAARLAAKAVTKLECVPDGWHGFPVLEIRRAITAWSEWLRDDAGGSPPDLPLVGVTPRAP
jgi:predicted metal-dependent hydrolase